MGGGRGRNGFMMPEEKLYFYLCGGEVENFSVGEFRVIFLGFSALISRMRQLICKGSVSGRPIIKLIRL